MASNYQVLNKILPFRLHGPKLANDFIWHLASKWLTEWLFLISTEWNCMSKSQRREFENLWNFYIKIDFKNYFSEFYNNFFLCPQNRELQIMRKLEHCNIVKLKYFFYSSGDKVCTFSLILYLFVKKKKVNLIKN